MKLANHMLSQADIIKASAFLKLAHKYFYHWTRADCIDSIKTEGLDPKRVGDDSFYVGGIEPENVMRYCTKDKIKCFYDAAGTRYNTEDAACSELILLRTKASGLLDKDFGLDHSYSKVSGCIGERTRLTPVEFVEIVRESGVISCYEVILADELEFCENKADVLKELEGKFLPLESYLIKG